MLVIEFSLWVLELKYLYGTLDFKRLSEMSALILSIVNGIILYRNFRRDRAILKVGLVHPAVYQWFFRLPPRSYNGHETRRYGFLVYLSVKNKGLREVDVDYWRLSILTGKEWTKPLCSLNISEPTVNFEEFGLKVLPVLGLKGIYTDGSTLVKSGHSISGMAYYEFEVWGDLIWDPIIKNEQITVKIQINSVLENKDSLQFEVKNYSYEKVEQMIPNLDKLTGTGCSSK